MILFYFTVGVSRVVLVGVCCYHGDSQSCGILKAPICLTLEEQYESIIIFIRADLLASLASAAAPSFAYVSSLTLGSSLYRALMDSLSPLFALTECSIRLFHRETYICIRGLASRNVSA